MPEEVKPLPESADVDVSPDVKPAKVYRPKACKGCGEAFVPTSSNQQNCATCMPSKENYYATRQKESRAAQKVETKNSTASRTPKSIVEVKAKEAAAILSERGLRHPHVIDFCVQLAQTAARIHRIPLNHYLFANGLRATLTKTKLPDIADEEVEGEILYRRDLYALYDFGFWRQPDVKFEQWLADRRRFKSSAFELSQILGKEDFASKHDEWTHFAPRWNPIGLRPGYTQKQGLAWLDAQRSDMEGDKKRYLLIASRNSMKSTWVRILALCLTITYPDARVLIISETNKLSKKAMKEYRGYLELAPNNPTLFQQYFGEFTVQNDEGSSLTYDNPLAILGLPQHSCESSSMESANTGSRFDFAIFDDPISRDNGTGNEDQRAAAVSKHGSIMKLREPAGFAINIQTPWEVEDLGDVMIARNNEDPEHPLAVRIDPVLEVKPHAINKKLLELVEDDVVLNFLPKLNWRFVRDEMRSPEGIKFFQTQYLCEWIRDDDTLRVQFEEQELRSRTRMRQFFQSTPVVQKVLALDRATSISKYADFSCLALGQLQQVEGQMAVVIADVRMERWRESDLVKNVVEMIEIHQPHLFICEQDRGWETLAEKIKQECQRKGLVMPWFRWKTVSTSEKAKAKRIKTLELPLSDGRFWFVQSPSGGWTERVHEQFIKFDGQHKSNSTRKDDAPDAMALLWQEVGPKYSNEVPQVDEQERKRLEEEEGERLRAMHFRTAMFGNHSHAGTRSNPAPPTEHAPTWRERVNGKRNTTPEAEPEPQAPQDPRYRIFGGKGPWRL
jgi:hypothetical protein